MNKISLLYDPKSDMQKNTDNLLRNLTELGIKVEKTETRSNKLVVTTNRKLTVDNAIDLCSKLKTEFEVTSLVFNVNTEIISYKLF